MQHSLEQIVIVPRNGYVNRLQAWASAAVLGEQFGVPVRVAWEAESTAPALPEMLFTASAVDNIFMTSEQLEAMLGCRHQEFPRYLTVDAARRMIVLAGHDRGEQELMQDLVLSLTHESAPSTLLLIAGGKFHVSDGNHFPQQRAAFYRALPWNTAINSSMQSAMAGRSVYLGLHVRGTDRSRLAPTDKDVRQALERLREVGPTSLFIAADSEVARVKWMDEACRLGFEPWSRESVNRDRTMADEAIDAMTDWRVLGQAQAIVYTAASSFGEEAAVCAGQPSRCLPLVTSRTRERLRTAAEWITAAATYSSRHRRSSAREKAISDVAAT